MWQLIYYMRYNTINFLPSSFFFLNHSTTRKIFTVGLLLRLSGGEPLLSFRAIVHYPLFEETIDEDGTITETQYFPFRTMAMLGSFITCLGVSYITEYLFTSGINII